MRSIWTGVISFGMVTIPVKLYGATEEKSVKLKLLHRKDGSPIEERRFCKEEGVEVEWDDLVRGYEVGKGDFVVLEPEEIEAAEPESARAIEIGDFVELDEIDPIYFEKAYFLEPQEAGAKAFNLLRRALEETGRVAVAKVSIRSRERLATLRVYDATLVLETMHWPDEIRSVSALELPEGERAKPASRELDMARALVENLSARFNPEQYEDRYRIALQELIEQKMKGEVRNAKRRKAEPKVVDLMEALRASVEQAKGGRDEARKKSTRRKAAKRSAA
jgi:DNA end-binding protein Ku